MPIAAITPAIATLIAGGGAAAATAYGVHSAGKQNARASAIQQQADQQQVQLEQQRDAEAKRQWDIEQAFQQKQYAAQEDDRLFNRNLIEQRDARMAPYRAASAAALQNLGSILGFNGNGGGQPTTPAPAVAPVVNGNTLSFQRRPQTLGDVTGLR